MSKKYWFKRRRYGYGWTPSTKEGWLAVAAHIGFVLVGAFLIEAYPSDEGIVLYLMLVLLATGVLITTALLKGPKPRWRGGKQPTDDPEEDW